MRQSYRPSQHLPALRAFDAVARLGSIKLAAAELKVTEGAVSRLIRQIEDGIGMQLFDRLHRGLRLTGPGEKLARAAAPAFARLRGLDDALISAEDAGPLVIAAPATFLLRWLIPRLAALQMAVGGRAVATATWDAPFDPDFDDARIVVGVGPPPDSLPGGPAVHAMMAEHFALVVNPRGLQPGRPLSAALALLPRLAPDTRPHIWADWIAEGGLDLPHAGERRYERMFFTLQAAEAGLGTTIAPLELVHDSLRSGALVAPFGAIRRRGNYHLMVPGQVAAQASVVRARRWLLREAKAQVDAPLPMPLFAPDDLWRP